MRVAAPILAILALLVLPPALHAGPGSYPTFRQFGIAPAYAVCTVEEIVRLGPVPGSERRSSVPERYFELHAVVRRAYPPTLAGSMLIRYVTAELALNDRGGGMGGGGFFGPPEFLSFQKGQTALFALEPLSPAKSRWVLKEWIPARPAGPSFGATPRTPREFLLRELVNTLTRAHVSERLKAASFVSQYTGDVPPELPRLLRASLGSDDDAWLETGCAFLGVFLASPGDPAEFTYGETSPPFDSLRKMVTWLLCKGDRRDYPNRLIRCVLRNAGSYSWGAANALLQYKDSTVFLDGINSAMRRNASGSLTIASFAAKAGKQAVLPDALDLAVRLVNRAVTSPAPEIQPAAQLILNYGSAAHFNALVAALLRFKRENESFYRELWGAAAYGQNPRNFALAAILIDDKRPGFFPQRYCDVAAYEVQRVSGQDFGIKPGMSPGERDASVARAAVWLAAHPSAR